MLKKILSFVWIALIALMTACGGINSSSAPSATFMVKVNYKVVAERARQQAERCWRGDTGYPVDVQINEQDRTARIFVTGMLGSTRMAELFARAIDNDQTEVKVTTIGSNIWDRGAVRAMQEVVEFGVPTCTSYMPAKQ